MPDDNDRRASGQEMGKHGPEFTMRTPDSEHPEFHEKVVLGHRTSTSIKEMGYTGESLMGRSGPSGMKGCGEE